MSCEPPNLHYSAYSAVVILEVRIRGPNGQKRSKIQPSTAILLKLPPTPTDDPCSTSYYLLPPTFAGWGAGSAYLRFVDNGHVALAREFRREDPREVKGDASQKTGQMHDGHVIAAACAAVRGSRSVGRHG